MACAKEREEWDGIVTPTLKVAVENERIPINTHRSIAVIHNTQKRPFADSLEDYAEKYVQLQGLPENEAANESAEVKQLRKDAQWLKK